MSRTRSGLKNRWLAAVGAVLLFVTACGSGGGGSGLTSEETTAARDTAESNEVELQHSGDLTQTQLLDARTGEVTTLSDVVTGDRPVLLWYWAPH